MARAAYQLDTSEVEEVLDECKRLFGDGTGLPRRLMTRLGRLTRRNDDGLVDVIIENGTFVAVPGCELLCVAAELRAIRSAA